ncbi:two-CW domain-containing protein, partial [Planctomycetota bacterium]
PFFVVDADLKIQFMNPACLEFTGVALEAVANRAACADIFKSNLCERDCAIRRAMNTRQAVVGTRVHVQDRHSREHSVVVNAGPLVDRNGEVLGGFEVWRDAMPDEELASRVSSLQDTLKGYCQQVTESIHALRDKVAQGSPESASILANMERRTSELLRTSNTLLESHCWDIMDCPPERQAQCPAFPNLGTECWNVDYTWCNGQLQGKAVEKAKACSSCDVHRRLRSTKVSEGVETLRPPATSCSQHMEP